MPDTVVIGGGVIGLAVAWTLQEEGVQTLLLERDRVGRGTSWAAGGMLCPVAEVQFTERSILELGLHSMRLFPDFVARLEAASQMDLEYDDTGTLMIALDSDEARNIRRVLEYQQELGLPAQWLSSDECLEREPLLSPRVVGGVHAPQDHQIETRKLIEALKLAFERAGGDLREHTAAIEVLVEGDAVRGVQTPDDTVHAPTVILAAGPWSGQMGGLATDLLPPIRPIRGQMVVLQMDREAPLTRHIIRGRRAYCVPRRDGRLLVGATSEDKGFEIGLTAGGVYELLRGIYGLLPGSYELPLIDLFAGLRPLSRDGRPVLGPSAVQGLVYATGHYRGGILLTPVTAWAIARVVLDGALPEGLDEFSPLRFSTSGATHEGHHGPERP